uniref:RRM domain-containing protein n=1 Tax=Leersia perrieri TaxID=77586 RepID=A0A0D9WE17_9ORYZ
MLSGCMVLSGWIKMERAYTVGPSHQEPLPSHGKHRNPLEETTLYHRCQASPHPINEQLRLHLAKTTEGHVAHRFREKEEERMSAPWDSDSKDCSRPEHRVYVRNLPYSTNESSLTNSFASYGALHSEIAWNNETGRSRGFGFVTFEDSKSANDAVQGMNGKDVGGRIVTVEHAQQRSSRWRR